VGARLGFGVVGGGVGVLARLIDRDWVCVGITTGAEAGVLEHAEVEDVLIATDVLMDVEIGPGVPIGGLLGAMKDELIETLEE
jgi:hypothetical protein